MLKSSGLSISKRAKLNELSMGIVSMLLSEMMRFVESKINFSFFIPESAKDQIRIYKILKHPTVSYKNSSLEILSPIYRTINLRC